MATDSLGVFNAAVSTLSAIAGAMAAWIAWKVHKTQGEGEYPAVSASFDERGRLAIRIENPTAVSWHAEALQLPRGAAGIMAHQIPITYDDEGNIIPTPEEDKPRLFTGSIPINIEINPPGVESRLRVGPGNVLLVRVHLQSSRRHMSMRLILRSNEALQRVKALPIKRTAPESIMIATD